MAMSEMESHLTDHMSSLQPAASLFPVYLVAHTQANVLRWWLYFIGIEASQQCTMHSTSIQFQIKWIVLHSRKLVSYALKNTGNKLHIRLYKLQFGIAVIIRRWLGCIAVCMVWPSPAARSSFLTRSHANVGNKILNIYIYASICEWLSLSLCLPVWNTTLSGHTLLG